jgi:hypothetical protein
MTNVPAGIKTNSMSSELRKTFSEASPGTETKMYASTIINKRENRFTVFCNIMSCTFQYIIALARGFTRQNQQPKFYMSLTLLEKGVKTYSFLHLKLQKKQPYEEWQAGQIRAINGKQKWSHLF